MYSTNGACDNAVFIFDSNIDIGECAGGGVSSISVCGGSSNNLDGINRFECNTNNECRGQTITITNILNNFELLCSGSASCRNANIQININDPSITNIQISCGGLNGCRNAMITINGLTEGNLQIGSISCSGTNGCRNAIFTTVNAQILSINCPSADACNNCIVNGQSC